MPDQPQTSNKSFLVSNPDFFLLPLERESIKNAGSDESLQVRGRSKKEGRKVPRMGTLFFLTLIRLSSLKNWKGKRDRRATERQSHHWHGFNSEPAPLKCTSRKSPGDIYRAGPNRENGLRQTFTRSAPPLPCRFLIATSFKMEISLREKTNTGKLAGRRRREGI